MGKTQERDQYPHDELLKPKVLLRQRDSFNGQNSCCFSLVNALLNYFQVLSTEQDSECYTSLFHSMSQWAKSGPWCELEMLLKNANYAPFLLSLPKDWVQPNLTIQPRAFLCSPAPLTKHSVRETSNTLITQLSTQLTQTSLLRPSSSDFSFH